MEHNTCRENLSAYLDGELPAQEKALVEAHLADCPECRAILGQLGTVSGIFKKHAMEPVPLSLRKEVLDGRPASRPWLKPVLAFSTIAAGVLIVLNLAKSPEQTSLTMMSKDNSFGSEALSMDEAAAPQPSEDAGRSVLRAGEAIPAAPASAPGGPAEEAGLPLPELNKERAERKAAAPAVAASRGAYGQAKYARFQGLAGAGGAGGAAMAGAKDKTAGSVSKNISYGSSSALTAGSGRAKAVSYVFRNYTRDGRAAGRFENRGKLYSERAAAQRALKPYYKALLAAGAGAAGELTITGVYGSDRFGTFIFYSSAGRAWGFIIMAGKSVTFKNEQPFAEQFWDVFEAEGNAYLLIDVARGGSHSFEYYRLGPGKPEFSGAAPY